MSTTIKKYIKIIGFGFLTWIIPFIISFFFYSKEKTLLVDEQLFKSIMIILGALVGVWLLVTYFKKIQTNYIQEGIIVGLIWLIINLSLDVIILLPMGGISMNVYIYSIGLRYLIIPIISIGMGIALKKKS